MKHTNKILTLILLLLSFSLLFSCSPRDTGTDSTEYVLKMPSKKLQQRFEKEYIKYMKYDPLDHPKVAIESWYGSFGDIHFLFVFDGRLDYPCVEWTEKVAESSFYYPNGQSIIVWTNEQFLSMTEAYEQNLITKDMVVTIANIHNGSNGKPIKIM